ncbi:MAG: diacylglycerol kinase family lipid kinase [Acidobacteria bacterium]|nr:diacylglycerol kinase family lipid kinase [Acidobacteriota bacterium]
MSIPIEVIVNAGSGSVAGAETKRVLEELFAKNGVAAVVHVAHDALELIGFSRRASRSVTETLVAAGGDGTIGAVAGEVFKTGKVLGVIPLGTLNNFSKDLGIPQNLEDAVRVIAENHIRKIDAAEVNGRIFINNSSIGLYPQLVRRREKRQRLGYGKWRAAFWAALRVLNISPFFAARLETGDERRIVRTPFVFVGNNAYEMELFRVGRRARLDDGRLSVYFLHRSSRRGLLALALRALFGRLRQTKDFEEMETAEITIETRKDRLLVAFDGEVEKLDTPLVYKIHPQSLRVIAPRPGETEN